MAITRSPSTPSHVPKKSSKMGLKTVANRNKGKCPVVENGDSDFAPQLSKRERAPPKKKSKVAAHEKLSHDPAQKMIRMVLVFDLRFIFGFFLDTQEKVNVIYDRPSIEVKSSDEFVTQNSDDDDVDDDDEDDDTGLLDPKNIDTDSDDGDELGKDGGDASGVDKVVGNVPVVDVIQIEVVAGSEERIKDVENVKTKESGVKGDDFFNGLSQLEIDNEQVVLASLEVVAKINVPNSDPNIVVEKEDAIASDEEADDTVTYTPLLDNRKRAPSLKSPFVDFGSGDVSSTPMEVMSSGSQSGGEERDFKMAMYVKGLYALNDSFSDLISPEIEAKLDAWIRKGLLKYPRPYNVYEDGAKKISPGFRLGVEYVEDKTLFYHLSCCDMFINDSVTYEHYLLLSLKKGKYSSAVTVNFATTDCLFNDSIQSLYHQFYKSKAMKTKMSHIHAAHPIAHYIIGFQIPCSKAWYEADHVLFIINLKKESHWVFGHLDLNEGIIFLYNSLRTAKMNSAVNNAMKAYSVLLPLFLISLDFGRIGLYWVLCPK
ncbi:hypothetical protein CsatB_029444 [Cannabis sativa]